MENKEFRADCYPESFEWDNWLLSEMQEWWADSEGNQADYYGVTPGLDFPATL